MSTTSSSTYSYSGALANSGLSSYYQSLVESVLSYESQKLTSLKEERTTLNTQSSDYATLSTDLDELQDAVKALIASNPLTELEASRTTTVDPDDEDYTVATATSKSTAAAGSYELEVTNLAVAQQRRSTEQTSQDLSLGYSGTIWLGGTGTASVSATTDSNITAVTTSDVYDGLSELGTSDGYTIEIREINGVLKYRLKDVDNNVVSIQDEGEDEGTVTTSWQEVTAGSTVDTGRGLTFTFGSSVSAGTMAVDYTAAGVSVTIEEEDSLINIANTINDANQPDGRGVVATVVGNYLVLTAADSGTDHRMIYSTDITGLGLSSDLESTDDDVRLAENAEFTVDGLTFTRSSNKNLTDVIAGVTLNLASDAEGQSATINIDYDYEDVKTAITSFIDEFNALITYLDEKTEKTYDSDTETYTEGSLAGDTSLSDLRSSLFSLFLTRTTGTGTYSSLSDIGIEIDDNLVASIDDEDTMMDCIENNFDEVCSLFEYIMDLFNDKLDTYAGSDGLVETTLDSIDNDIDEINYDIDDETDRLSDREDQLVETYGKIQAQMAMLSYTQSLVSSLMGSS